MTQVAALVTALVFGLVYHKKNAIFRWWYRRNKNRPTAGKPGDLGDVYRLGTSRFGLEGRDTIILTEEDTPASIQLNDGRAPIVMASLHPGDIDVLPVLSKYNHSYHTRKRITTRDILPWISKSQSIEILLRDGWLEDVESDDCVPI